MGLFTSASVWGVGIVSGYNHKNPKSNDSPVVPVAPVFLNAILISVEHVSHIRFVPLLVVGSIGLSATTYLAGNCLGRVLTTL